MPARLLLVTDSLEPSGVGEHMLALAQGLREDFEIVVAAFDHARGDLLARASELGFSVQAMTGDDDAAKAMQGFDLAHIHAGIGWEGHELVAQAHEAGIGVVLRTEHLPYVLTDPAQQEVYRQNLDKLSGLICVSQAAADSFVTAGVPDDMIWVVRNGVVAPVPRRSRRDIRHDIGVADAAPLAVTVARLTEQKNHAALLAAVPTIITVHPDFRLAVVGTGPLEAQLREEAASSGNAVLFLGHRNDVPDLLAAADLFVLPSLFEGLPLSLIEAMAAGLPVVASDIGGTNEVVKHGSSGILTAPPHLADAVLAILNDRAGADAMARAGRMRFESDFSHSRMSRETCGVYRHLLQLAGTQNRKFG